MPYCNIYLIFFLFQPQVYYHWRLVEVLEGVLQEAMNMNGGRQHRTLESEIGGRLFPHLQLIGTYTKLVIFMFGVMTSPVYILIEGGVKEITISLDNDVLNPSNYKIRLEESQRSRPYICKLVISFVLKGCYYLFYTIEYIKEQILNTNQIIFLIYKLKGDCKVQHLYVPFFTYLYSYTNYAYWI